MNRVPLCLLWILYLYISALSQKRIYFWSTYFDSGKTDYVKEREERGLDDRGREKEKKRKIGEKIDGSICIHATAWKVPYFSSSL